MIHLLDDKNLSATDAKSVAKYIAFSPYIFQAAATLRDLNVFQIIDKKRRLGITLKEIAEEAQISEYGVSVLLDFALTCNFIRIENDNYYLTKVGFFLTHDEMTNVNFNFTQHFSYEGLMQLTKSIQTGKPEGLSVFGDWPTVYPGLTSLPEKAQKSWFEFDHFYSDNAFDQVLEHIFAEKPKRVLDIGGNTGRFALRCLNYNDSVNVTIMDLPQQLAEAQKNMDGNGFTDRFTAFPCDMLDPKQELAKGADIVWMSQFLDCFTPEQIETILKNVVNGIDENQQVFILETLWDIQKFNAAAFSLNATSLYFTCFANGNSRMYGAQPMLELIERSGLVVEEQIDEIGLGHTLIKCRKLSR